MGKKNKYTLKCILLSERKHLKRLHTVCILEEAKSWRE